MFTEKNLEERQEMDTNKTGLEKEIDKLATRRFPELNYDPKAEREKKANLEFADAVLFKAKSRITPGGGRSVTMSPLARGKTGL